MLFVDFEKAYEYFYRTVMAKAFEIWRKVLKGVKKKWQDRLSETELS